MYQVISEFVDRETGRRVKPGEDFSPSSPEQAHRLVHAGCLVPVGGVVTEAPASTEEPAPSSQTAEAPSCATTSRPTSRRRRKR